MYGMEGEYTTEQASSAPFVGGLTPSGASQPPKLSLTPHWFSQK